MAAPIIRSEDQRRAIGLVTRLSQLRADGILPHDERVLDDPFVVDELLGPHRVELLLAVADVAAILAGLLDHHVFGPAGERPTLERLGILFADRGVR